MRRREFITLIGSVAAIPPPFAARAQQDERVRRIGVLMPFADDPGSKPRIAAFLQGLERLNWTVDHNVKIDIRWDAADAAQARKGAAELLALAPDVIVAITGAATAALQEATQTLPIVFAGVVDPVGGGYVASLAHPGGNITGFAYVEYGISGKWLELLKEVAPGVNRVAILQDPALPGGAGQFGEILSAAPSFGIEISSINVRDLDGTERAIADFARAPNGGVIVTASVAALSNRTGIVSMIAEHRLPAVYFNIAFVRAGGLISYGADAMAQYGAAASYVDRILKGEKPANLPVQAPTKYELAINLKTANGLGFTVPSALVARADEVIE